jgi:hypothetical protein
MDSFFGYFWIQFLMTIKARSGTRIIRINNIHPNNLEEITKSKCYALSLGNLTFTKNILLTLSINKFSENFDQDLLDIQLNYKAGFCGAKPFGSELSSDPNIASDVECRDNLSTFIFRRISTPIQYLSPVLERQIYKEKVIEVLNKLISAEQKRPVRSGAPNLKLILSNDDDGSSDIDKLSSFFFFKTIIHFI